VTACTFVAMAIDLSRDQPSAHAATGEASICFVACVESGPLEAQTVRLAESLRRYGGALAGSEILAVTSRFGPPLSSSTRRRFRELGVRHERLRSHPKYAWYHYLNKPLALVAAENLTDATLIAWLDSDIVVLAEPEELALGPDLDFAACVPDTGIVGTTGPGSPNEAGWRRLCDLLGIDIDALPWVVTDVEQERIRLYFNSGVFSYRRGIGFSDRYLSMCLKVLDSHFGFRENGEHYTDQLVLGLTMLEAGLRWRQLPHAYNFAVASFLPPPTDDDLGRARILHYHDGMDPHFYPTLVERLEGAHQTVNAWLAHEQPLTDPAPLPWRLARQGLRVARGVPRRRYRSRVT
jgi:hypothetical protein